MLRYAITSGSAHEEGLGNSSAALVARCAELARNGVDFVLVRETELTDGALAGLVRGIVAAVAGAGTGTNVLVAGRADVATAAGAAGVNLSGREGELTPAQVRRLMPGAFVSVSCHTVADVQRAYEGGASAALFAPVFGKTLDGVEVVRGVGLDALREACATAGEMLVFALGGVTEANAPQCIEAGAAGVAGIRMFG